MATSEINKEDRRVRINNYIKYGCCSPSGKIMVSALSVIAKKLLAAKKDRDKSLLACGDDYKNARTMTRIKEARCAEELSFLG